MLELNKIYCCDVLEGLSKLDDESIDLIITSPPYNKMGLNGKTSGNNWIGSIVYGNNSSIDNKDEHEYENWQIEVLNECHRVLKSDGSMFYNHKNRIIKGMGEISNPYSWISKTNFKIRQEIIWNRGSTNNVDPARYLPTTEKIFWLTKSTRPRFKRNKDTLFKTEIWSFPFKTKTEHPAPFPIDLPNNIIPNIAQGEKIVVLDPFMGSGTTAMSAILNNCDYIGFELLQEYVDMANRKIAEATNSLFPL